MDKYIKKLSFDFPVQQKVLQLISQIDTYKGKWHALEQKENKYLKELRQIAAVESIGSSTRIEGATMTDKEIEKFLSGFQVKNLQTRDEQEVMGYYDTLQLILENYDAIPLTENHIKQLHQNMLKYSDKDTRHRGHYKTLSNKVVATYPGGKQKVIFNTTEVHLVEKEMQELIRWTNEQLKKKEIHPLLVIALFVYEFLSIHPFQDGNGRLSRLLTTFLLLQNGYDFVKYVSFENLIEQAKKDYYRALMEGQKNRNKPDENIAAWTLFFLEKLYELTRKLEVKYETLKAKGGYLNDRQKNILAFIRRNQPVKISDIAKAFPDINIHTLKKDLQYMKREKAVRSIGKGKGTVYIIDMDK
ncbi:MAG: Fic family protein [Chlorobi bacterium]|nr:Fic family protein [Chlorobiota bacterium]